MQYHHTSMNCHQMSHSKHRCGIIASGVQSLSLRMRQVFRRDKQVEVEEQRQWWTIRARQSVPRGKADRLNSMRVR